jgi:outer membrane protein assembly factor BamD (BamD/ComL family)
MAPNREQATAKALQLIEEIQRVHEATMAKLSDLRNQQQNLYKKIIDRWDREALDKAARDLQAIDDQASTD